VRAELLVELLVAPLAGQVEVDLAQRRREGVGVAHRVALARRVLHLELVAQRQGRTLDLALEEPGRVALGQLDRLAALGAGQDLGRRRAEGAHDHAAVVGVRPEQAVWIGQVTMDDGLDVGLDGHSGSSSRRTMPATGMLTQSGRLLSS
jgi:hypothetical protein